MTDWQIYLIWFLFGAGVASLICYCLFLESKVDNLKDYNFKLGMRIKILEMESDWRRYL